MKGHQMVSRNFWSVCKIWPCSNARAQTLAVLTVFGSNVHSWNAHFLHLPGSKSARAHQEYGHACIYHFLSLLRMASARSADNYGLNATAVLVPLLSFNTTTTSVCVLSGITWFHWSLAFLKLQPYHHYCLHMHLAMALPCTGYVVSS